MVFKSIKFRLTLWYVGTLALIVVFFSVTLYVKLKRNHENNIEISLEAIARGLKNDILEDPDKISQHIIDQEKEKEIPLAPVYTQIIKKDNLSTGEIIAKSASLRNEILPSSAFKDKIEEDLFFKTITESRIYPFPLKTVFLLVKINSNEQYGIEIASPLRKKDDALSDVAETLFILDPILLIIALLGGYSLMSKTLQPVKNIVLSAKKITAEDLSHRIKIIDSKDEIGELAATFNDMISRLERSFMQIKQFSSDVSHELKTPITAIRGMAEVALRKKRTTQEYVDTFKKIIAETKDMQVVIDNLLFLSRTETQDIEGSFSLVALDEVLLESFEGIEILAKEKNVYLILNKVQQANAKGEKQLIKRLFSNLIDNAIKYTPKGGTIEIFLEKNQNFSQFSVKDTGIGISKNALPYIFNRFYKADESRHREVGSSGLGLSIVKRIVELHKGRIDVKSNLAKGSTFTVFLPIQD